MMLFLLINIGVKSSERNTKQ